jgi:hypothetical protein
VELFASQRYSQNRQEHHFGFDDAVYTLPCGLRHRRKYFSLDDWLAPLQTCKEFSDPARTRSVITWK